MRQGNPFRPVRQRYAPSELVFGTISALLVPRSCHAEVLTEKTSSMKADTKAAWVETAGRPIGSAIHE